MTGLHLARLAGIVVGGLVSVACTTVSTQRSETAEDVVWRFLEIGPPSVVADSAPQVKAEFGETAQLIYEVVGKLKLSISVPAEKDLGYSDFASLDGLADNITAGASYSHQWTSKAPSTIGFAYTTAGGTFADSVSSDYLLPSTAITTSDRYKAQRAVARCVLLSQGCGHSSLFADGVQGEPYSVHVRAGEKPKVRLYKVVAEVRVGRKQFEFYSSDAEATKEAKLGYSGKLSWVCAFGGAKAAMRGAVSAAYESRFENGKVKATDCTAIEAASGLEECRTLPLGAPAKSESIVARADLQAPLGDKVAANLILSWNAKKDTLGVSLPIYFVAGANSSSLQGGVRFGWRSDTHDFAATVFVGKPLGGGD